MAKGGKLRALEDELGTLVKELARFATQAEIKEGAIADEKKKVEDLRTALEEVWCHLSAQTQRLTSFLKLRNSLEAKRGNVERLTASHLERKEKHAVLQSQLATSEELLQTLVTGLSSSNHNSAAGGYLGQLADAKARAASAATEEEEARMRMTMVEKELKEKEVKWKAVEKEAGDGEKSLTKARKDVQILEAKLASISWDSGKEQEADAQIREAREQVRSLTEVSSLSSLQYSVQTVDICFLGARRPEVAPRQS